MYIDLMAQLNYISVNKKAAHLFGRDTAIYWAELVNVITKVIKEKNFDNEGYFKVDRDYIFSETTLTIEDQIKCDKILAKSAVLESNPKDDSFIRVDLEEMSKLLISEDTAILNKITKLSKASASDSKEAKQAGIRANLMKIVRADETSETLIKAYENWMISLQENKKALSKPITIKFISQVRDYSTDKNTQLKIVELAMQKAYNNAEWVIKSFNSSAYASRINKAQTITTELSQNAF